jgi:hypothetical protein
MTRFAETILPKPILISRISIKNPGEIPDNEAVIRSEISIWSVLKKMKEPFEKMQNSL